MFIIRSLGGGGAQRVATILLHHIDKGRFEPALIMVKKEGPYLAEVPDGVSVIDLKAKRARYAFLKIVRLIRKRRPDVVFSSQGYINLLIAISIPLLPRKTHFIARETNIPSLVNKQSRYWRLLSLLYRNYYKRFDTIICQSEDMKQDLVAYAGIQEAKLRVIHNPINFPQIEKKMSVRKTCFPAGKKNILAAGKFMHQKGFDLLLHAFSQIADPNVHLTILGEGPEEENLRSMTYRLALGDRVTFPGFTSNPYVYMRQADLFVLSSRFEGLPNVVLEANACGTPVVAFDCPGGISEIIEEGVNGWKVNPQDTTALASSIVKASQSRLDPKRVKEYVADRFPLKEIVAQYEDVFLGSKG